MGKSRLRKSGDAIVSPSNYASDNKYILVRWKKKNGKRGTLQCQIKTVYMQTLDLLLATQQSKV